MVYCVLAVFIAAACGYRYGQSTAAKKNLRVQRSNIELRRLLVQTYLDVHRLHLAVPQLKQIMHRLSEGMK